MLLVDGFFFRPAGSVGLLFGPGVELYIVVLLAVPPSFPPLFPAFGRGGGPAAKAWSRRPVGSGVSKSVVSSVSFLFLCFFSFFFLFFFFGRMFGWWVEK